MADSRTYYYMRVKEDFYETDEMKILQSMDNGYLYSDILMKLYLKSLKNDGRLMFKSNIPYDPKMISTITGHNIDTVEKALRIFKELGLIDVLDNGAIYMLDIQNFIGKTSTEADRKKQYRKRIESEKNMLVASKGQMSGQMSGQCPLEIEKEIEIKKELELKKEKKTNVGVVGMAQDFNIFTYMQQRGFISISSGMAEDIQALIEVYSLEEVKEAIKISDENQKHTLSYVRGILQRRRADGNDRGDKQHEPNLDKQLEQDGIGFTVG